MNKNVEKLKVILIDPWGTANTSEYLSGLIYGLCPIVNVEVFTNRYFTPKVPLNANIHAIFFKRTEKMSGGIFRKGLRGIEYIMGYMKIFNFLKECGPVDIVHINWLLNYKMDIWFLKAIRKYTKKIVYTAHNVLPHINGEQYIRQLKQIYSICDRIILHGESIKKEFEYYFPDEAQKVYIQKHGSNLRPEVDYDETQISEKIKTKVKSYKNRYLFLGRVFYNKGPDRLLASWKKEWNDSLLIIAGHRDGIYPELAKYDDKISKADNILEINDFIEENTLRFLIDNSELILLPYRHASMSGVVFTAADFRKPILCTNVGALPEYLLCNEDSFIVDNSDEAFFEMLTYIHNNISKKELVRMGENLNRNISMKCSWAIVAQKLVSECYKD